MVTLTESPTQGWIISWTDFLRETLPTLFLVIVLGFGLIIMIRRGNKKKQIRGGLAAAIAFGLAAALVYLLLTHVADVADWFHNELPVDQ